MAVKVGRGWGVAVAPAVVVRGAAVAVVGGEGWEVEGAVVELAGWAAGVMGEQEGQGWAAGWVAGEGLRAMVVAGAALEAAVPAPCSQRLSQSRQPWLSWWHWHPQTGSCPR